VTVDGPASILLVDDRPENLLALEGVLAPLGHRLVRAGSGEEALRHLLRDEHDLIVLDVQMPGMDGFETARHIRSRPRNAQVPIIFLTAISREQEHQLAGYDVGAVDYVAKPFDPDVLRAKVGVLVERSQLRRTVERQAALLAQRLEERDRAQAALARQTHELERSNAELERFAGAVAVALRDPLLTTAGFLDLLRTGTTALHPDEAELAALAAGGVDRALGVLEGLARLASVTAEPPSSDEVDLDEVVDEALAAREPELAAAGAAVRRDPLPRVRGDRWQLVQVVGELVDNALAHRADVPLRLQLSVSRREDRWVLTVRDNGVGVDPGDLPRLFTVFPGTATDRGGPGIGLATCRRIVERHGGEIWAESVPERGTAVSFSLPAAAS
jgi:signal transduction histidine kinase